ncbi:MAG: hypothetical protein HC903_13985 [Methylacidiphilales bacterium]|nr:hypothetical protein [Candidatus Methylacidiphilales bacterium]
MRSLSYVSSSHDFSDEFIVSRYQLLRFTQSCILRVVVDRPEYGALVFWVFAWGEKSG